MKALLMITFTLLSTYNFAQNSSNQLLATWNNSNLADSIRLDAVHNYISINYHKIPPDSIFYLAQMQYEIAKNNGMQDYIAKALNSRGKAYSLLGDFEISIDLHQEALKICEEVKCDKGILESITNLGNVFYEQKDYLKAIEYYQRSVGAAKNLNDPKQVAAAYNGLATIYKEQSDNRNAELYFKKGLQVNKSIDDKNEVAHSLCNLAIVNAIEGNFDAAIELFKQTYEIQKTLDLRRDMSESLLNIANIYYILGDNASEKKELESSNNYYRNAVRYNERALTHARALGAVTEVKHASKDLMMEYYRKDQTIEPIQMHDPAIGIRKRINKIERKRQKLDVNNSADRNNSSINSEYSESEVVQTFWNSYYIKWASIFLLSTVSILYFIYYKRKSAPRKTQHRKAAKIEPIITIDSMLDKGLHVNNQERPKLVKDLILAAVDGNLNDSDWNILNALYESPGINNREISKKVSLSVDGVRSSLRKMYRLFDIPKSQKNQRIALIVIAIKISNADT